MERLGYPLPSSTSSSEYAGYDVHIDWNQNDAYHYPPTPYRALAPISLPPDRHLPALSPVLAGGAIYRPFPAAWTRQNNIPIIIERSRIPVFIFAIRLSGHTGDIRMVTLSNEGAVVSVNDVLEAVRAAIAGRQPAFAPAAAMAQIGTIRLDEKGRLIWSGFEEGIDGVWELSLVSLAITSVPDTSDWTIYDLLVYRSSFLVRCFAIVYCYAVPGIIASCFMPAFSFPIVRCTRSRSLSSTHVMFSRRSSICLSVQYTISNEVGTQQIR